jgi:hypothetical protein
MASSGEKKYAHRRGKREVMNMELYDDHSILAELGWQDVEQPWSSNTALQYVKLAFSDRMWPRECHTKNIEKKSASWCDLVDIEVKWRFLTILQAISNSDRYARNIIPVSIVSLMYAEHVLRVPVDWSTLPSTGFGCFFGNVSNEKANSNSLCTCPSLVQERSSSSGQPRISNSSQSRTVVAVKTL